MSQWAPVPSVGGVSTNDIRAAEKAPNRAANPRGAQFNFERQSSLVGSSPVASRVEGARWQAPAQAAWQSPTTPSTATAGQAATQSFQQRSQPDPFLEQQRLKNAEVDAMRQRALQQQQSLREGKPNETARLTSSGYVSPRSSFSQYSSAGFLSSTDSSRRFSPQRDFHSTAASFSSRPPPASATSRGMTPNVSSSRSRSRSATPQSAIFTSSGIPYVRGRRNSTDVLQEIENRHVSDAIIERATSVERRPSPEILREIEERHASEARARIRRSNSSHRRVPSSSWRPGTVTTTDSSRRLSSSSSSTGTSSFGNTAPKSSLTAHAPPAATSTTTPTTTTTTTPNATTTFTSTPTPTATATGTGIARGSTTPSSSTYSSYPFSTSPFPMISSAGSVPTAPSATTTTTTATTPTPTANTRFANNTTSSSSSSSSSTTTATAPSAAPYRVPSTTSYTPFASYDNAIQRGVTTSSSTTAPRGGPTNGYLASTRRRSTSSRSGLGSNSNSSRSVSDFGGGSGGFSQARDTQTPPRVSISNSGSNARNKGTTGNRIVEVETWWYGEGAHDDGINYSYDLEY